MSDTRGRLPDFIFGRDRDIEREAGLVLAGTLVTDIPKYKKPSKRDRRIIQDAIAQLVEMMRDRPTFDEAGIWRDGDKPPDGLSPPFDDQRMEERCKRCRCITIHVESGARPGGKPH